MSQRRAWGHWGGRENSLYSQGKIVVEWRLTGQSQVSLKYPTEIPREAGTGFLKIKTDALFSYSLFPCRLLLFSYHPLRLLSSLIFSVENIAPTTLEMANHRQENPIPHEPCGTGHLQYIIMAGCFHFYNFLQEPLIFWLETGWRLHPSGEWSRNRSTNIDSVKSHAHWFSWVCCGFGMFRAGWVSLPVADLTLTSMVPVLIRCGQQALRSHTVTSWPWLSSPYTWPTAIWIAIWAPLKCPALFPRKRRKWAALRPHQCR